MPPGPDRRARSTTTPTPGRALRLAMVLLTLALVVALFTKGANAVRIVLRVLAVLLA